MGVIPGNIDEIIEKVDGDLKSESVPIHAREIHAVRKISMLLNKSQDHPLVPTEKLQIIGRSRNVFTIGTN